MVIKIIYASNTVANVLCKLVTRMEAINVKQ